jgi:hypothetical protein
MLEPTHSNDRYHPDIGYLRGTVANSLIEHNRKTGREKRGKGNMEG